MKGDISLPDIGKHFAKFFKRYGLMIFFLVIAGAIVVVILLLNSVIAKTDDAGDYVSQTSNISFDEETIKKIEALPAKNEDTQRINASGRLLPF